MDHKSWFLAVFFSHYLKWNLEVIKDFKFGRGGQMVKYIKTYGDLSKIRWEKIYANIWIFVGFQPILNYLGFFQFNVNIKLTPTNFYLHH